MASSRALMRSLSHLREWLERKPRAVQHQSMTGTGVQVQVSGSGNVQVGGNLVTIERTEAERADAKSAEQWAQIEAMIGTRAERAQNLDRKPPGGDWKWHACDLTKAGGQWYRLGSGPSSEKVDAVAVPDERRPAQGGPVRKLLGYLIRLWLRKWLARLEGKRS